MLPGPIQVAHEYFCKPSSASGAEVMAKKDKETWIETMKGIFYYLEHFIQLNPHSSTQTLQNSANSHSVFVIHPIVLQNRHQVNRSTDPERPKVPGKENNATRDTSITLYKAILEQR